MQRLDGVSNGSAVPHDLRGSLLGVQQEGQGFLVAGEVAVGTGEVDLVGYGPLYG